jgi:Large-conductance mechanosensitive channel, MscL
VPSVPDAGGVLHEARKGIGGFKKFILRGNVVDLAIGVVIGAAFGNVVQVLVKDIIQPLVGAFGGRKRGRRDVHGWSGHVPGRRPRYRADFLRADRTGRLLPGGLAGQQADGPLQAGAPTGSDEGLSGVHK